MYLYVRRKSIQPWRFLIRNKLKEKMDRGTELFGILLLLLVGLFGWIDCFLSQKQQGFLIVRFIKISKNECIK